MISARSFEHYPVAWNLSVTHDMPHCDSPATVSYFVLRCPHFTKSRA
jgi:hypothetical protein